MEIFLGNKANVAYHGRAAPFQRDWQRLSRFSDALQRGLQKELHNKIRLQMKRGGTISGILKGVTKSEFTLILSGGKPTTRQIKGLVNEQKAELARQGWQGESWDALVLTGLFRLAVGDEKAAAKDFAAASRSDPDREHCPSGSGWRPRSAQIT